LTPTYSFIKVPTLRKTTDRNLVIFGYFHTSNITNNNIDRIISRKMNDKLFSKILK